MGKWEMIGKRKMRIEPEGADVVEVSTDAEGNPEVTFTKTKQDPPADSPAVPEKKKSRSMFDPE